MIKAFVDTDVILDFIMARQPFDADAAQIFVLSEKKQIYLCTTALVFSNAYYVLRKLGTHKKVINKLSQLSKLADVIGLSKSTVELALESDFSDFEDALQNFAAVSAQVNVIVTRNTKDFKNSSVAVLTPDQFLKSRI